MYNLDPIRVAKYDWLIADAAASGTSSRVIAECFGNPHVVEEFFTRALVAFSAEWPHRGRYEFAARRETTMTYDPPIDDLD